MPDVDRIMTLRNGAVVEKGTYSQLMELKGAFYGLIREHGKRNQVSEVELLEEPTKGSRRPSAEPLAAEVVPEKKEKKEFESKIISKETSAKGSVDWKVYQTYALSCHMPSVITFLIIAVISQGLSVSQNVFLSMWANANDAGEANNYMIWLLGYGVIGLSYSTCVVLQVIFVWIFCGRNSCNVRNQIGKGATCLTTR